MLTAIATVFLVTLFFGFLSALVIQKILHGTLRFRSEWGTTLTACMMTALVCEFTMVISFTIYEGTSLYILKVIGTTAVLSLAAGITACRLIIRSQSGRHLPMLGAVILAVVLTTPPAVFGLIAHAFTASGTDSF